MIGKFIPGEGNQNAYIFIVGSSPGQMEARIGRPFCGPAGLELNRYLLMQAGVKRRDCWLTTLVRYQVDDKGSDPTSEDIARDEPYLLEEINHIQPKVIVPVGRIATRYFLGDVDLEFVHGIPHWLEKFQCYCFPVYHPNAGLHSADKFSKVVYNSFKRLGAYLNGGLDKILDINHHSYEEDLCYDHPPGVYAVDTEGYPEKPWGLSYSLLPGSASVITVKHPLQQAKWRNSVKGMICHNALWDLKVLRAMGIDIDYETLNDTMLVSHLLCLEPKKLKALAYREAGMQMETYQEVIKEADERITKTYLQLAYSGSLCGTCQGVGSVERPWKRNPNKTTSEKCGVCAGDGSNLPKPETQLVFNDDFTAKLYTPESTGRRLRTILSGEGEYRRKWKDLDIGIRGPIEARFGVMPSVNLDDVTPRKRVIDYSARDADATLRVYRSLRPRLAPMGLEKAYEIDLGCIPIIDKMHQNGILIDKQHFRDLDTKFEKEQYTVLQQMYDEIGLYFNPSSPPQMKRELEKLGIKGLESTDERTLKLQKLKTKDPKVAKLIDLGLEYREISKMRGTYTNRLIREADENSRIHTTFILSAQEGEDSAEAPSTGRLSSRNPNLQNIPAGQGRGESIRAGFIAKPGCSLLSVDLSQIELRVGAHLAQETNMIEAFKSGLDLHTLTASKMFGVPYDQVDKKAHRYPAKTISFGVFYGMSRFRLQSELAVNGLTISIDDAQDFINAWFAAYPGIKRYMHNVQSEVRQNYFVRTMFGRIRYLPNVHSRDDRAREAALRQAGNAPVQGSAAELLKIGLHDIMSRTVPLMKLLGIYCEPILSIHDEIILEIETSYVELLAKEVIYDFEQVGVKCGLSVPMVATAKAGSNWATLKELSL